MTNPEADSSTSSKSPAAENAPSASDTAVKSEFLERVSEIPVVSAAKGYGTAAYNQVKQMNRFTAAALSVAETTALYFAITAKPFLEKVQPQVQLVDGIACRGLDAVEVNVPFLLKPPEQLVEDARKLCSSTVELGYQKVEEIKSMGSETLTTVKNYGLQKATETLAGTENLVDTVKNYGLQKANETLAGTEGLVDKYLPPAFGEGSAEVTGQGETVPERARDLTSKIGLRIYGHGFKQLLAVHRLSQESVSKLVYTVELLQHFKQNYANKSVQECIDEAKLKATWIWDELNKEPADSTEVEKSLEQRMLSLARRTTSILVHTYNSTVEPISTLPTTYHDGLQTARRYASELFSQIDQATNAGEVTVSLLQAVREKLAALEQVVQGLTTQTEQIEMQELSKSEGSQSAES